MTTNLHRGLDHRERLDPFCLRPNHIAALLAAAPWRRLAVVGDSIAEGLGDPVDGYLDVPWADRLAAGLRAAVGHVDYLNVGRRGLTAGEIRASQLEPALAFDPDLAVVTAGANDMLRPGFDPDVVEAEFDVVVGRLAAEGTLVVTFGLLDLSRIGSLPQPRRGELRRNITRLNAVTRIVTERHRGIYVDFFGHPATAPSLFSSDLIHPNRRGHSHIAAAVVRALAAHRAAGLPSAPAATG